MFTGPLFPDKPQSYRVDLNTGARVPIEEAPPPSRVGPGIRLEDAVRQQEQQLTRPEEANQDVAQWLRHRSSYKAMHDIVSELFALRALVLELQEKSNGTK
jgi:hypothetical protein